MRKLLALPLVLAIAACGDDGPSKQVDAAVGGDDAQDIDAPIGPTGNVKITITSGTTPMVGVRVHFQNADSSLVASVDTDANGVASADMVAGGYVTAVDAFAGAPGATLAELTTFAGVKPGDELVLTNKPGGSTELVDFTVPTDSTAGVTQYLVSTVCESNTDASTTVSLGLYYDCQPTADVIIASLDANDEVVNFAYVSGVDTSGTTVNLTGQTLAAPTSKTFTYNNIPASAIGIDLVHGLFIPKGILIERSATGTGTTVAHTLKLTPFTNAVESFFGIGDAPYGFHMLFDWGPFSTNPFSTDVGARMLREATSGASYDNAAREITWTEAATGVVPDFIQAHTQTYRTSGLYIDWDIVAPYTAGELKYPTVPVEGTDYNAQPSDVVEIQSLVLAKSPGGYDAIREQVHNLDGPESLGASGAVTLQEVIDANMVMFAPLKRLASPFLPAKRNGLSATWKSRARL